MCEVYREKASERETKRERKREKEIESSSAKYIKKGWVNGDSCKLYSYFRDAASTSC